MELNLTIPDIAYIATTLEDYFLGIDTEQGESQAFSKDFDIEVNGIDLVCECRGYFMGYKTISEGGSDLDTPDQNNWTYEVSFESITIMSIDDEYTLTIAEENQVKSLIS